MEANTELEPVPVSALAAGLGLEEDEVRSYGLLAAKIELTALDRLASKPDGRIVSSPR
jgi:formyltetrahydrofolate synthetase